MRCWSDGQVLLKQTLGRKLSCCLQDPPRWARSSKPLLLNSLRQKLSCCLQDRQAAGLGRGLAVCGDSPLRPAGESRDTYANNHDAARATSAGCPDTLGDSQYPFRFVAVIVRTPPALALGVATNGLLRSVRGGLERLLAIATAASDRQGQNSFVCPLSKPPRNEENLESVLECLLPPPDGALLM